MKPSLTALASLASLAALSACATSPAATPRPPTTAVAAPDMRDGLDVLRAMHDRYASTWYRTLTFVQTTTVYAPGGEPTVQTWWEAGAIPGRLRIDTDSVHLGTGVLFRADSTYEFVRGRLARARPNVNELLVLGFDVYGQPVERTAQVLRARGYDLARVHADVWRGAPVWVVGALAGDTASKQFWVEQDRLLFVRLLETQSTAAAPRHVDLRFERYVKHGGGWVAEEVSQLVDGRPRLHERYADVRVDVPLDEGIFLPETWLTARHWAR